MERGWRPDLQAAVRDRDRRGRARLTTEGGVYLVFFAWDQADLTPVTQAVLRRSSPTTRGRPTRVVVAGHADRSGTEAYNLALSEQRAQNVPRARGARRPASALDVQWFGESRPRIPTADGVREPQNRRVEIVFGGPRRLRPTATFLGLPD